MDADIYNLLRYADARADEAAHEPDMILKAGLLGYTCEPAAQSSLQPGRRVLYAHDRSAEEIRGDIAHELGHGLMREGLVTFEEVLRHRHASVPDMDQHLEVMADLSGDRVSMPRDEVAAVLNISGVNARAVWVLHQMCQTPLREALRRIVHFDDDRRVGGFVLQRRRVVEAASHRWYLPFWRGDEVSSLDGFEEGGGTLFRVPGYPSMQVGLIVID